MAFLMGLIVVLLVCFSIALAGYITFYKTNIQNFLLKMVLFAFLSVCVFLVTSMTALLVLWPPL